MQTLTLLSILILIFSCYAETHRKNVLFISVDDLRPQYNAYLGADSPITVHPKMITPNIDSLASKSFLLKRAHTQISTCAPSRTSFLTARRPDTLRIYEAKKYWRRITGNFTTLPQYFKQNGYHSVGMGKVFHGGTQSSNRDDPISWSAPYYQPDGVHYTHFWYKFGANHSWYPVDQSLIDEEGPLPDQQVTEKAIETLKSLNGSDKPFFFALGITKPHLPFVVPREFFDLYPMENISLPTNPYAPIGMPTIAWSNYMKNELKRYQDLVPYNLTGDVNETMPDDLVRSLRRGYYAATSYADDLIGKVLDQLEKSGLADNTIIAFLSDHGFHLGNNGNWHKHTNFEKGTHTPMMIHVPGMTDHGIRTDALAEIIDIFPTLVELAGLPKIPICPEYSKDIETCIEGVSMVPLMQNPTRPWKSAVFSQFRRHRDDVMGYTVRTDRYRYTEWPKFNHTHLFKPIWSQMMGIELYDYQLDPEETVNRANDEEYQDIAFELRDVLRAGWRSVILTPDPPTAPPDNATSATTEPGTNPPPLTTTEPRNPKPTSINEATMVTSTARFLLVSALIFNVVL